MEVVAQHFRPEFINRIDDVVVFHPLGEAQIKQIALLQIERLRLRLSSQNMHLEISDEALAHISTAGFDPVYGARPLKRAIQQLIENPLAQSILAGKFAPGDTIVAEWSGEGVRFAVKAE